MVDADELDAERARPDDVARRGAPHIDGLFHFVFDKLVLKDAESESRSVNGNVDCFQNVGQSAYVILVSVGYEDAADLIGVLFKIGDVGDDKVYAEHIAVGETDAAVNDDDVVFIFKDGEIFADLTEPAEKDDLLAGGFLFFCHRFSFFK